MKTWLKLIGVFSVSMVTTNLTVACHKPPSATTPGHQVPYLSDVIKIKELGIISNIDDDELPTEQQLKELTKTKNPDLDIEVIKITDITRENACVFGTTTKYYGTALIKFHIETESEKIIRQLKTTKISYKSGEGFDSVLDLGTYKNQNLILEEPDHNGELKIIDTSTDGWKSEWSTQEWRKIHLDSAQTMIQIRCKIDIYKTSPKVIKRIKLENSYFPPTDLKLNLGDWGESDFASLLPKSKLFDEKFLYTSDSDTFEYKNSYRITELNSGQSAKINVSAKNSVKFKFKVIITNNPI